jgi:two-component system response regulator PilR (NtrC family)
MLRRHRDELQIRVRLQRGYQYRKQVLEYDEVMEHQRRSFYGLRQRVLHDHRAEGLPNELLRVVRERDRGGRRLRAAPATAAVARLHALRHGAAMDCDDAEEARDLVTIVERVSRTSSPVLIVGETGTGKELVARAIHTNSSRSERSFVTVNSGNLPPDLLESTLFGHVKGAFTGAVYPKKGMFDLADKGSIFFDEIGNVPIETQAKLLRVIQERDFMRLGGMETIKVDVRIIAATNVDLRQMMEDGKFREDLFYRLHVITIQLPPLRDRKDDIPLLAHHFLEKYGEENKKGGLELTPDALDLLTEYDWPGNVRELENVIERAVVLSAGPRIGVELIPDHVRRAPNFQMPQFVVPPEGISFKDVITDFEKRLIESTLEAAGGVQKRAAELLHIKPTTLNEMIKRYEIRPRRRRLANGNEAPASAGQPASDPRSPTPTVVGPLTPTGTFDDK